MSNVSNTPAIQRGYSVCFYPGEHNHCPGCGKSHWAIGRMTAECVVCACALPLSTGGRFSGGTFTSRGGKGTIAA